MVSEGDLSGLKLSTVVPASITGEDKSHHLTGLDLAMKLHYITTVHFFGGDAVAGLGIHDFKSPMFKWLQLYYPICGRLRRRGDRRPYVKCNDGGVRIVEAASAKTVAEWLDTVDCGDHHRLLVYDQHILARDFGFTPLVFLQITKFKCGGMCVGMRWAHILGDAFAASECINTWGKIMASQKLPPHINPPTTNHHPDSITCRSVKLLESVGDNWLTPNTSNLQTHTLHLTENKAFDLITAIVWKSVAKVRGTRIINICKERGFENGVLGNGHQMIGVVESQTIGDADRSAVLKMIANKFIDETSAIEKLMEEGDGDLDVVVYGSNLTFVDLGNVDLYGLQIKGRRPIFADISIGGVGDEGAVVVVPDSGGGGRVVKLILPQEQLEHVKNELRLEWGII